MFLAQYVDQPWKDKYIASYTSMSGAFGGRHASSRTCLMLRFHHAIVLSRIHTASRGTPFLRVTGSM